MPLIYDAMAQAITARRLETSLLGAERLESDEDALAAAQRLKLLDFDQAPVFAGGVFAGMALRSTLEATGAKLVADCVVPADRNVLISADSPLPALLPVLASHRFACVLSGNEVTGFVTTSDLNKQLARTHFFLMLASLEVLIGSLIRSTYSDQRGAVATLPEGSQTVVRSSYEREVKQNTSLDHVAVMDFTHVVKVAAGTAAMRSALGYGSKTAFLRDAGHLPDFRNRVMHPTRDFFGRDSDVQTLIGTERLLRRLIDAAMAEVERSNPWLTQSLTV